MTRDSLSTLLARVTAASFTLNTVLHTMGYATATGMAGRNADLRAMLAVLWLAFAAALIAFALAVLTNATPAATRRRSVLLCAAIFPLSTAILMMIFMGFIAPVALLAMTAGWAIAAAVASPLPHVTRHV